MKNIYIVIGFTLSFALGQVDHVVFTEVVLTPSDGEYVEISNPTESGVDLTNYYLTDGTDISSSKLYYNLPIEDNYWSGSSTDFICRFPNGYTLAPGAAIKISLRDNSAYESVYGQIPDISLDDDMLSVSEDSDTKGNPNAPKLHNSSETLILFYWDGSSAIVKDVDYLIWGNNSFSIDKSGVDGYLSDTPASSQSLMPIHATNEKLVRLDKSSEGMESQASGNGITGHDETSEPLADTWIVASLTSSKPEISNLSLTPSSPFTDDLLNFEVDVNDDDGISSVILRYEFQQEITSLSMSLNDNSSTLYTAKVDPLGSTGSLIYSVIAEDINGLKDSTSRIAVEIKEPIAELTIAEIVENIGSYDGQIVEIDGVVTIPAGKLRTNFTEAFLQDESGKGIILYNTQLDTSFNRGDSVLIVAEVDDFDGKPELIYSSITILKENASIPVEDITVSEFNSLKYNYTFVKIWGKVISRSDPFGTNTGANISIQDASGEVTTMRIWNSTNILYNTSNQLINPELDSLLQVGQTIEVS